MRPVDTTGVPGQLVLAFRRLRRAPGFTVAAVLLLGGGVGLGIPLFNSINVFLLKPAWSPARSTSQGSRVPSRRSCGRCARRRYR
jgi:hypothetical protein